MSATKTLTTAPDDPARAAPRHAQSEKSRRLRGKVFLYVAMSLFGILFLFPLVFMFVSSLKPDAQILQDIDSPHGLPAGRRHQPRQLLRGVRPGAGRAVHVQLDPRHGADRRARADRQLDGGVRPVAAGVEGPRSCVLAVIIATLIVPFETIAVPMVYWVSQLPTLVIEGGVLEVRLRLAQHLRSADRAVHRERVLDLPVHAVLLDDPEVARRGRAHRRRRAGSRSTGASSCRCRARRSRPSRS